MLYASYLGRAGAWAYFTGTPCIALGVTGGGVNADNPDAQRRFLSWERLSEDLRAAAAHTSDVYVFSLEGCVERGMLQRIAEIPWDAPPPRLSPTEVRRARRARSLTQWVLRAEPVFDLLLPAKPRAV